MKAIREIPALMLEKTEDEVLKKPTTLERKLKISFWNAYKESQRQKRDFINLSSVLHGVCGRNHWNNVILTKPNVLAWILKPPADEFLVWQELLQMGHKKLRKTLSLPLVEKRFWKDRTGEIHIEKRANVGLIKEVRAIVESLQNRIHGSVVQRAETKSLNINVTPDAPMKPVSEEMTEIKMLLARIEKAAKLLPEPPPVILEGVIPEDVVPDDAMEELEP